MQLFQHASHLQSVQTLHHDVQPYSPCAAVVGGSLGVVYRLEVSEPRSTFGHEGQLRVPDLLWSHLHVLVCLKQSMKTRYSKYQAPISACRCLGAPVRNDSAATAGPRPFTSSVVRTEISPWLLAKDHIHSPSPWLVLLSCSFVLVLAVPVPLWL